MNLFQFTIFALILLIFPGCALTPVFHNTADSEIKVLSESLINTRLEDLFRQYPTLRLVKSTSIGNGNMRHEFSYAAVEKEDDSQRPSYANVVYLYERQLTYSINIFVDGSGVIYEVLQPVLTENKIILSNEPYDRFKSKGNPNREVHPTGGKTRSLPYP